MENLTQNFNKSPHLSLYSLLENSCRYCLTLFRFCTFFIKWFSGSSAKTYLSQQRKQRGQGEVGKSVSISTISGQWSQVQLFGGHRGVGRDGRLEATVIIAAVSTTRRRSFTPGVAQYSTVGIAPRLSQIWDECTHTLVSSTRGYTAPLHYASAQPTTLTS